MSILCKLGFHKYSSYDTIKGSKGWRILNCKCSRCGEPKKYKN